jgi:hypothetical protein
MKRAILNPASIDAVNAQDRPLCHVKNQAGTGFQRSKKALPIFPCLAKTDAKTWLKEIKKLLLAIQAIVGDDVRSL